MENIIEYPDPINRGWEASTEGLCPLWYSCEQLPPSITEKGQNIKQEKVCCINKKQFCILHNIALSFFCYNDLLLSKSILEN